MRPSCHKFIAEMRIFYRIGGWKSYCDYPLLNKPLTRLLLAVVVAVVVVVVGVVAAVTIVFGTKQYDCIQNAFYISPSTLQKFVYFLPPILRIKIKHAIIFSNKIWHLSHRIFMEENVN